MRQFLSLLLIALGLAAPVLVAAEPSSAPEKAPRDSRLAAPKTLDDYFPFTPPTSKDAWEKRRRQLREQVLVATGLWPLPPRTPLHAVVHGTIERDDYTIEKVFFASYPGHYVTGNLYRPRMKTGKMPGVLSPHGHWQNGRFYEANPNEVQSQLKQGAEKTAEGARYPLQARCAQLARMGCVVFHYDMVGYADSTQIEHRKGFLDPEAELRLQSFMGLQTWNSIRALDFLLSLPEVDPQRIGVTGASGGGTQTFILGAIDDRPTVTFPAVMVSTAMQGGCVCENCSDLRVGTGNIELAALFAPRPLGMSGADDWTKEIETKGLPQLKALYRLLGAEDKVMAKAYLQFGHNYNQVSRELMYNWFNKHLKLGQPEPVVERPFVPVPPKELSVFDAGHPMPADAVDAAGLRRYLTATSDMQVAALKPKDAASLVEFRRVVGTALRVMVNDSSVQNLAKEQIEFSVDPNSKAPEPDTKLSKLAGVPIFTGTIVRKGKGEAVPVNLVIGNINPFAKADDINAFVIWVHPQGCSSLFKNGKLVPAAQQIIDRKGAILALDVFETGDRAVNRPPVNKQYAGFTFGYNRPLLANRVHDILTVVALTCNRKDHKEAKVHLVGFGKAGPWVLLARGLCGDAVARTAADMDQFRFENIRTMDDEMMLPGAVK
ncbi:MAG TPA: acetylxylan esterase, partial [Gemmataceae bacterium]|nr:acetylxylan esterase [Gemmataceae bacterium]